MESKMTQQKMDMGTLIQKLDVLDEDSVNLWTASKQMIKEERELLETRIVILQRLCEKTGHSDPETSRGFCSYCGKPLKRKSFWR